MGMIMHVHVNTFVQACLSFCTYKHAHMCVHTCSCMHVHAVWSDVACGARSRQVVGQVTGLDFKYHAVSVVGGGEGLFSLAHLSYEAS